MTNKEKQILNLLIEFSNTEQRLYQRAKYNKDIVQINKLKRSANITSALAYRIACILCD